MSDRIEAILEKLRAYKNGDVNTADNLKADLAATLEIVAELATALEALEDTVEGLA